MRRAMLIGAAALVVGSVAVHPQKNPVCDGSFEAGFPNECWDLVDSQNSLMICDLDICTIGDFETGPRSGTHWLALGSIINEDREQEIWQPVRIPEGASTLEFYLQKGTFGPGDVEGRMDVVIDGETLYSESVPPDIPMESYRRYALDIPQFADGAEHELMFRARTDSGLAGVAWMIDDVAVTGCSFKMKPKKRAVRRGHKLPFRIDLRHHRLQTVEVPVTATLTNGLERVVVAYESRPIRMSYRRRVRRTFRIEIPQTLTPGTYTLKTCIEQMSGDRTLCKSSDVEVVTHERE